MVKSGPDALTIHKQISRGDVIRFAEGSGADPSTLGYEELEEALFAGGELQRISGRIRVAMARSTQDRADTDPEGESQAHSDSADYLSNSGLDDKLDVEQTFTLQLTQRRKRRSLRSLASAHLYGNLGLTRSTLTSLVDESTGSTAKLRKS